MGTNPGVCSASRSTYGFYPVFRSWDSVRNFEMLEIREVSLWLRVNLLKILAAGGSRLEKVISTSGTDLRWKS